MITDGLSGNTINNPPYDGGYWDHKLESNNK